MSVLTKITIPLTVLLLVVSCGQLGELYLPNNDLPQKETTSQTDNSGEKKQQQKEERQ